MKIFMKIGLTQIKGKRMKTKITELFGIEHTNKGEKNEN